MELKDKIVSRTPARRKLFGQILVGQGIVTEKQIAEALATQRQKGGLLGDVLVSLGYVTNERIIQALSNYLDIEVVNIEGKEIPREVIEKIPAAIAQLYRIIPISITDGVLTIVQEDALNLEATDDLRLILKHNIKSVLCHKDVIARALEKYYPKRHESVEQLLQEFKADEPYDEAKKVDYIDIDDLKKLADTASVKKWVGLMFLDAVLEDASDIHFEAGEDKYRVRYRIDGVLYEKLSPPIKTGILIISKIKIISCIDNL